MPPYIGQPVPRREDRRLITGQGRYAGDIRPEGLLHVAILRSPLAHATITALDVAVARAMPGVAAVVVAADLPDSARVVSNWVSADQRQLMRPVLAGDVVRYAGEAIAAVVAETAYQANDAVAAIGLDLEARPAAVAVLEAAAQSAPAIHDSLGGNVARRAQFQFGEVESAFAGAPVVVREHFHAQRIVGAAMEPRVATASWDGAAGEMTVWSSTQGVFSVRDTIADALQLEKEAVHVLAHDVGGGFGPKGTVYAEEVLVAVLARMLDRPVTWTATRSEDTTTTVQAHGTHLELELAAGADGRLRGLRGRVTHDLGAYPGAGSGQLDIIVPHMMSAYQIPAMDVEALAVCTNTTPTGFIRGGGRPLGNWVMERLIDRLAARVERDPAEVRLTNMVTPDQMPYETGFPQGRRSITYDSGDYPAMLRTALDAVDYRAARARQGGSGDGRLIGIGMASCVESSGFGSGEPARVRIQPDGTAHLFIGSTPQGQGHDTAAAQVLADRLGWPIERVVVVSADTRAVPWALFTAGSRTAMHVGNAVAVVAKQARERILEGAAETLEADPADLVLEAGVVSVRGVPGRSLDASQVYGDGLEVEAAFDTRTGTAYSSGCHACVLEVDRETGSVQLLRYVIVHDTGKVINPMLVEGQMHGGFAHGLGFAMFEEALYTREGALQSGSFLDYTIVSAPEVGVDLALVPAISETEFNPEGFKGAGESGTIPVPACIVNAIEDALRQVVPEVAITEIPVTPQRIFEILSGA